MSLRTIASHPLAAPGARKTADFLEVLERRRSSIAQRPLSHSSLSALLWYVAAFHSIGADGRGRAKRHRGTPSAGGIQPIEIFVEDPEWSVTHYDPLRHTLNVVEIASRDQWDKCRAEVRRAVRDAKGTLMCLIADVEATASRYSSPESLVFRDAGAMAATLQLAATALSLDCTQVGMKGEAFLDATGLDPNRFLPCGVLCVGDR